MHNLAMLYRAAQFFAHNAHNLAKGQTFFEDHEFLGDLYGTYEEAYDALVERMIGLGEEVDLLKILSGATKLANDVGDPANNTSAFTVLLTFERKFRTEISAILANGEPTDGVQNLLQGMADESEARTYKLGQRVK